jgi:hypothetical protein
MGLFRHPDRMDPNEIEALAGLRPLYDPVFNHLLEGAYNGSVAVYFAAVPLVLVRPFDPDYDPTKHPIGEAAVRELISRWSTGQFQNSWVYQKGQEFVLSDDYIVWEAAKRGLPDFLPCWILGKPTNAALRDVQGPIGSNEVAKLLGFPPFEPQLEGVVGTSNQESQAPTPVPTISKPLRQVSRWHWAWLIPVSLFVLVTPLQHTIPYAWRIIQLYFHRWNWVALVSPSNALCLATLFTSVAAPVQGVLAAFALASDRGKDSKRFFVILGIWMLVLVLPFVTDTIIWGSFPFNFDADGIQHLRLIPFFPWPNAPYGQY